MAGWSVDLPDGVFPTVGLMVEKNIEGAVEKLFVEGSRVENEIGVIEALFVKGSNEVSIDVENIFVETSFTVVGIFVESSFIVEGIRVE